MKRLMRFRDQCSKGTRLSLRVSRALAGPALAGLALAGLALGCGGTSPAPCEPAPMAEPVAPAPPETKTKPVASPTPSLDLWADGPTRRAIVDFVAKVTDEKSPDFVPEKERIATFDNDGTLWSEQPMYVQMAFVFARLAALAPEHPEWKTKQPFRAALEGDLKTLMASGKKGLVELLMATHAGMTSDEFERVAREFLDTAQHPQYQKRYTDLTYAPMVELLQYLRAHGFKTFIVSGGGVAFMRPFTEAAYGIAPDQVVGSRIEATYQEGADGPVVLRDPQVDFIDDGPGKPVGIYQGIGMRPIFAAGNSDGDLQMLEWTMAGKGPRFALVVHHTDGEREVAYDRQSPIGKLDKALDIAKEKGWTIVDMKMDWRKVFAFQPLETSTGPGADATAPARDATALTKDATAPQTAAPAAAQTAAHRSSPTGAAK